MSDKQMPEHYPGKQYQPLFDFMHQWYGLSLLESDMADIIEVVNKMQALHPSESAGAVWVKLGRPWPSIHKTYIFRRYGNSDTAVAKYVNSYSFSESQNGKLVIENAFECSISDIEWLDETAANAQSGKHVIRETIEDVLFKTGHNQEQCSEIADAILQDIPNGAQGKADAVAFAEWLWQNRWFHFENGKWYYTFEMGTAISDKSYQKNCVKTTTQLYDIYKQSK